MPPIPDRPVPPALAALLACAARYPPALALAREDLRRVVRPSLPRFHAEYARLLRRHLAEQPTAPYVLAEVVRAEPGRLALGDFVWLVRFTPSTGLVHWVTPEFSLRTSRSGCFRVSPPALDRLVERRDRAPPLAVVKWIT